MFVFSKDSLNSRAVTPKYKLDEGNVYTLVNMEYQSSLNEWVFEKTNMISSVLFAK